MDPVIARGMVMNGEIKSGETEEVIDEGVETTPEPEDTVVLSKDMTDIDDDDDVSVEINVEELVAKLEATDDDDVSRKSEVRRRLDELHEQREAEAELDSTYNFNLDDEL